MNQENMLPREEKGFTFADFWYVIRKFWLLIVAITAASTVIGTVYTFAFAKTDYKSSSNIIVAVETQSQGGGETIDYNNSLRVVNTIGDFVDDDLVLEKVASQYNVEVSYLRSGVRTSVSSSSFVTFFKRPLSTASRDAWIQSLKMGLSFASII